MPSRGRLIAVGLIAFALGLLLLFPARVAYHWFAPPALALSGIEGSVWRGSARDASIAGVYFRDLDWQLRPLGLLTARLRYRLSATPAGGFAAAQAAVSPTGNLRLTDLQASLRLENLADALRVPGLAGIANLQFERLDTEDGVPTAADGTLEVAGLRLPLVATESIGGYRAEFFTQEDGIVASVEDTDGSVDVAGRLLLGPDRSYQFLGQIAPKANTPDSLRQQMRFLGTPNARGQYELRLEGAL